MSSSRKKSGGGTGHKAMPPEALELVAARFRALAEPMRLRLLNVLMEGERSVTQLVEVLIVRGTDSHDEWGSLLGRLADVQTDEPDGVAAGLMHRLEGRHLGSARHAGGGP